MRYPAGAGISQFLDIGIGLPTANNTHEAGATEYIDSNLRDAQTILGQVARFFDGTDLGGQGW